jgi:STE24 endopeptidase
VDRPTGTPESEARARRYHRLQLLLGAAGLAAGAAYLLIVLAAGLAAAVARAAATVSPVLAWRVAVVAIVVGALERVIDFPLTWVRGFVLPRRYGLLHQSFRSWLLDGAKAAAIGGLVGLVAVEVIYALLATTARWWLVAAVVLIAVQALLAFVFPVLLMPIFYRMSPLTDETVRARLQALAARAGIPIATVCVADQSRKSRTANAAVAGFGRTRRIVLFDTLVARFAPAEIEAVLAHELGHHARADVWRGLGAQAALTIVALWIADHLLRLGPRLWGLAGPADPAGLPWLALILSAVGVAATPLVNAFSRRLERRADDYALALTRDPAAFIGAMERLASLNLAQRAPHPVTEALLHSHPSIERRIARARTGAWTGV